MSDPAFAARENGQSFHVLAVKFERVLPGPIENVWRHLTDPKLMPAWFGGESRIEARAGGRIDLMGGHIRGVVTQCAPPRRLAYSWNVFDPGDPPEALSAYPESYITFDLEPAGDDVRLTLTHLPILDRFEKQNAMGWHTMLDILGATVRGGQVQERAVYSQKNADRYGVDLANLQR
jgi:uncharacterized protein YndB with AHSA1/START domain